MQGDIQRSGQVYTHQAPWDKSESVSLLEAVLIYCRSQMPPLDPRDFRTEDMKHVVPLVNWPLATVVRDARDCTRRYTRMRTVWKNSTKQLHSAIRKFIRQNNVFPEPDPLPPAKPALPANKATNNQSATSNSSNGPPYIQQIGFQALNPTTRTMTTSVERSITTLGQQPLQNTTANTIDLTNMRVMPTRTGAVPTGSIQNAHLPSDVPPVQSILCATFPHPPRKRHIPPNNDLVVMPLPPLRYTVPDSARSTPIRRPDAVPHGANVDSFGFTWYDSKSNKHIRTASQNMSDHIKLYKQHQFEPKTVHLFHAIAKLERPIKAAEQFVNDATAEVQTSTDAATAVKSLLAVHASLINVPDLQTTCDKLVVEKQKVLTNAKAGLDRLYRRLDSLWVAVEEFTMGGRVCVHELHCAPFLTGFITEYATPNQAFVMDVDPSPAPELILPSPLSTSTPSNEEEVLPSEPMNETPFGTDVEPALEPVESPIPQSTLMNQVYVLTPTHSIVVCSAPLLLALVGDASGSNVEVDVSGEMIDAPQQEEIIADAHSNHALEDILVTRESPKRLREYNVDEDREMRPPTPKDLPVEPSASTKEVPTEEDDQFIDALTKARVLQDMPVYQLKMFAEKQDVDNTLLVRVYQSFPSHSRITYSTTLSLDTFNSFVYASVEDQKEVLSTRGRGKAVNGKYDKFDLVLAPATLKRYGRRGYITKYGNAFCIEPTDVIHPVNKT